MLRLVNFLATRCFASRTHTKPHLQPRLDLWNICLYVFWSYLFLIICTTIVSVDAYVYIVAQITTKCKGLTLTPMRGMGDLSRRDL